MKQFTTNPKDQNHIYIIPPLATKITGTNNHLSLISLNINRLNSPVKRCRPIDWILKQDSAFCCIKETNLRENDRHYLRVKSWKKVFQANGPRKQTGVAILIFNKIDLQPKVIKLMGKGTSYLSEKKFTKSKS
jgi:exonuclease III